MTPPDSASQAFKWVLVLVLAFFAADSTAALIERRLAIDPKPLPQTTVGEVQANVPAQAAPSGLVTLLETTVPEGTEDSEEDSTSSGRPGSSQAEGGSATPPPALSGNLQLRGTMADGNGSGLAMIDVNGQTQVVSTGEEVEGALLVSVSAYSVTLEVGGEHHVLDMNTTTGPTAAAPPRQVAQQRPTPTPRATPEQEEEGEPEAEEVDAILTQRELRNILNNPSQIASQGFRMRAVMEGEDIVGMRVSIQNPSHPLARLGIQNGDVVKSLNGTPLDGPEALSTIYRVLRNTSNLSFEVDRGGVDQKVEVTLEE